jgi:hypothetical protein
MLSDRRVAELCYLALQDEGHFSDFVYMDTFRVLVKIMHYVKGVNAAEPGRKRTFYHMGQIRELFSAITEHKDLLISPQLAAKDELITRLFNAGLSICALPTFQSTQPSGGRVCFKDEFSKAVLRLEALECATHMCFTFNLMAEISQILDSDRIRPQTEPFDGIEQFMASIAYAGRTTPHQPLESYFTAEDAPTLSQMRKFIHLPGAGIIKGEVYREGTSRKDDAILKRGGMYTPDHRDMEEFSILHLSPLFCGTALLNLRIGVEDLGLRLANTQSALTYGAQFYEALRGRGLLPEIWPDMEEVIRVHLNTVFFGSRPTTADQRHKRLCLRNGLPLTEWSPDIKKPKGQTERLVGNGPGYTHVKKVRYLEATPASQALSQMFKGEISTIQAAFSLNTMAEKQLTTGKRL